MGERDPLFAARIRRFKFVGDAPGIQSRWFRTVSDLAVHSWMPCQEASNHQYLAVATSRAGVDHTRGTAKLLRTDAHKFG